MNDQPLLTASCREGGEITGDDDALLPWWSIAKSVLAAATLRLAEMGVIGLDERYEDYPFTIRQILNHSSGLTTYGGPDYHEAVMKGEDAWDEDDLLERYSARRLRYEPGTDWAYSNIGYMFIRRMVENQTGSDLGEALDRLVFSRAGITGVRVLRTREDVMSTYWGGPEDYDPGWVYHGMLAGTPVAAVRFLRALLDGEIIGEDSLKQMLTRIDLDVDLTGRPWTMAGYGLGLMMGGSDETGPGYGHSGVGPGSVSALYAFPDLPGRPIATAFTTGGNEAVPEREVIRLAMNKSGA